MTADPNMTNPAETPPADPPADPNPAAVTADDRLPDDHPVVKALAKANKEAEAARLKVKEFEDAQLTEQERLSEQLSTAAAERDQYRSELMRERIGRKHGLPESLVSRLRGDDEDQLDADAKELAELLGEQRIDIPARPQERLKSGSAPSTQADARTPQELADEVIKRSRGY